MNSLFARLTGLALGLLVVAACSTPTDRAIPANRITFNNFEALQGWIPPTPTLTNAKAHSGHFAVKVDKDNEYGTGYQNQLGHISPSKLKTITVNAWALRTGADAKAAIVVVVSDSINPNKPVFWQALDLAQEVKTYNHWVQVRQTFALPDNIKAQHKLLVYLWRNGGSQPVYLDDLELLRD